MPEFGTMAVDWEERIDFARMRRYRVAQAQKALAESDAEVLLINRMEDVRYISGFRHHLGPVARLGNEMAVMPKEGGPILYVKDRVHARARMPWMDKEQIREININWREYLGLKEWADDLQSLVGDLRGKKIGVDLMTVTMLRKLEEIFPESELVDGWTILSKGKMVKSEDEIECIKAATMITEAGFDALLRKLRPGVKECELLAEAWRVFTELGSEWSQCANIVCSGPYTAPYRRFTSDRIVRLGDPVIIDIGAGFNGYWGDFTRTWICGDIDPTPEQVEWHMKAYNAVHAACDAARVGNTNADIFAAAGPYHLYSLGHAAGINPWEPPFLTPETKNAPVPLKPNMVFNIEPYAGKEGVGGFRLEQNVIVRESGPEVFTTFPFDERLVTDVHPLDRTTGRTRNKRGAAY